MARNLARAAGRRLAVSVGARGDGHGGADDGGQVAGLAVHARAGGRRRCRGAAARRARRRRSCSSPASARAGRTWSARAPRTSAAGPGVPVSGWTRSPARPERPARQVATRSSSERTAGGGRPSRASRAAVSTRPRTRPARVTASSTRSATSAVRTSTVGQVRREPGVEVDHAGVEHGAGGEDVVDQPVVGGGVGERLVRAGRGPAEPRPGSGSWRSRCPRPARTASWR